MYRDGTTGGAPPVQAGTVPFYAEQADECLVFEHAFRQRLPVLLKGPTGCGKTRFVEHMAARLQRPLVTVSCHDDLTAADLVGRYLIGDGNTVWIDGPLARAVRQGAICYLDEVVEARKDTTVVLHPLADDRRQLPIERTGELVTVFVHTARPGVLIGKKGTKVDEFRQELEKLTGKPVRMKIIEIHRPEMEANLVAEAVAEQLGKRINYRRALKKVAETSMAAGAKGIKIRVAGRLQGAEMSRVGNFRKGRIPCTTLRAQLDYGFAQCATKYGTLGCKVWIFKGEYGPGETTCGLLPVRTVADRPAS